MVKIKVVSGTTVIFEQIVDKDPDDVASYWTKAVADAQDLKGYLSLSDNDRLVILPMSLLKQCTVRISKT